MELLLYLDAHDHPIEIHPYDASSPSLIGNIYVARVDRVMPQIHAAFLKADDLTFFYPMEDTAMENIIFTGKNGKKDALVEGDELLVQVIRDAIKSKEICVSTNLSFSSAHLLLTTGNRLHGKGENRSRVVFWTGLQTKIWGSLCEPMRWNVTRISYMPNTGCCRIA